MRALGAVGDEAGAFCNRRMVLRCLRLCAGWYQAPWRAWYLPVGLAATGSTQQLYNLLFSIVEAFDIHNTPVGRRLYV